MADATVVLVHGALAGSWIWWKLTPELEARDIAYKSVDLPTCSAVDTSIDVHDDARHVHSVMDEIDGPIVLLGNSYGGVVITEAAVDHPRVRRLVYLAAFMPEAGENLIEVMTSNTTPEFGEGIRILDDGRMSADIEMELRLGLQQASSADHEVLRANTPEAMSMGADFSMSLAEVAWRTIPSTYVVCTEDLSIKPDAQRKWATERATDFVEFPFDHCPQVSHPKEIADLLTRLTSNEPALGSAISDR